MAPSDPYLWLIGALLILVNLLLFLILKLVHTPKHKSNENNNPSTRPTDVLQRKSRDYRGIPAHFFGSDREPRD